LAAFVLPGFVTLQLNERTHTLRRAADAYERTMQALYYSVYVYAGLLLTAVVAQLDADELERHLRTERDLPVMLGVALLALLVLPALISITGRLGHGSTNFRPWVLRLLGVNPNHEIVSGWDFFFKSGRPAMVLVYLKDGGRIGGYYGRESFAGYSEHKGGLLLEQQWRLDDDDWFSHPVNPSMGVWIPEESVARVEFYTPVP